MPKVSKVGKFRKAAATAATTTKSLSSSSPTKSPSPSTTKKINKVTSIPNKEFSSKTTTTTTTTNPPNHVSTSPNTKNTAPTTNNTTKILSRGQRRRQAKREQYLKRSRMVLSVLKLRQADEQKKRIDGLNAIKEALLDVSSNKSKNNKNKDDDDESEIKPKSSNTNTTTTTTTTTTNKAKKQLAGKELEHMGLVLSHPAFNENPFNAIREHLSNTLSEDSKRLEEECIQRRLDDKKRTVERKVQRKERLKETLARKKKKGGGKKHGAYRPKYRSLK